jgi:hypothetical protein
MKYRTGQVAAGIGTVALVDTILEGAYDPKALFTNPEQSEYEKSKASVLRYGEKETDVFIRARGFVTRLSVPVQEALLGIIKQASLETWPDTLGKMIEEYDPELFKAIKSYDPDGKRVPRIFLTIAAEQLIPGIPVANLALQTATGLDYQGNPIVPEYMQNEENPSAEVSDRTSLALATFSKELERVTGKSFSPQATEYFLNQILPTVSNHVLATMDRVVNMYADVPELPEKEGTFNPLSRYNNLNQVRRDEYKVTSTYHTLWKESSRSAAEYDNAKEFYEQSERDEEDAANFLRIEEDNRELTQVRDTLAPFREELKNLYKQRTAIIKDVDLTYTTPDKDKRPWFGSKEKLKALRELRLQQLDVMDRALASVKELPNGEYIFNASLYSSSSCSSVP